MHIYEYQATAVLAKLHQLDWKQIGLGDFGKDGSTYYERQVCICV